MLLGERLSIVTSKSQTTRQNIKGFVNEEDYQIILVDTPGFIDEPAYQLQLTMNSYIELALEESDVLLFVVDKYTRLDRIHPLIQQVLKAEKPTILIINKADQSSPEEMVELEKYYVELLNIERSIPISAEMNLGREVVLKSILDYLPIHPPYYDKEEFTDRTMRFIATEIIREKIFENYQKEIPYSTEVVINRYEEGAKGDAVIEATIYVERESQKNIVIGHQAEKLKKISMASRKTLEEMTGCKIHLYIFVKVLPNWRSREHVLKQLGYEASKDKKNPKS